MARGESKDLLTRLADAGEEAIHKLADAPGADRVFGAVNSMRDRVDELQRRVRGLEDLEKRLAAVERKVEKLGKSGASSSSGSRSGTAAPSTKSSSASHAKKS